MQISANTFSQSQSISINVKNYPLEMVFQEIEKQTDFRFLYRLENVEKLTADVSVDNSSLEQLLDELCQENDISYKLLSNNLVVIMPAGSLQQKITGAVTDVTTGEPLPGVYVVIEGTQTGVITDEQGKFNIEVISPETVLVFSYIGYISERVTVGANTLVDIQMTPDIQALEEIVVIGYGTMKKADLTGSVISVDMKGKDMAANVDLAQTLQGYLPGVNASAGSLAGEEGNLSIRGQTSLSASDKPLIVRDGIIFNGSLSEININDIETVDVLKDASAAAVYGNRSANGVIIITTKKGKTEKPMFNFNTYFGFQQLDNTVRANVMNGEQYAQRLVDYYYTQELYEWYDTNPTSTDNRPLRADLSDRNLVATYLKTAEEQKNYLAGNEIDWVDEIFRTAPIQNYNLSVSGQTNRTNYYLSGSYMDQNGILENDQFKRSTISINLENKITNWMTLGLNASYAHLDYSGGNADLNSGLAASPWADFYNEDGSLPQYLCDEGYMPHPLKNCLIAKDVDIRDKINMIFTGKFNIPWIKGLTYELNYAKYLNFEKNETYNPSSVDSNGGTAYKDLTDGRDWSMNNILTYTKTLDRHKITATYLYTREKREGKESVLNAYLFENETLGFNAMQLGTNQSVETGAWQETSLAYMGRFSYVYDNKYLLTTTLRKDGYSAFGANKKYGYFPSVSLGWVLTEESFMNNVNIIDYLKIRGSYGLNGNQGIGRYESLSQMASNYYVYDGTVAVGLNSSTLGNADLGWEKTASFNLGLDFGILNHRISGEVDVYTAKTTDVLVERALSGVTGYTSVWDNIGGVENKGIELEINTRNIETTHFSWKSRITFSLNRNKITKLYGDVTKDTGNEWFVGHNINSYYSYVVDGVWQEEDLFNGSIIDGFYPGEYRLKDISGEDGVPDGVISADYDRTILGSSDPNYRFGIYNAMTYKNLTLSFFINSIQGGNDYYLGSACYIAGGTDQAYRVNRTAIRPYWTPFNPTNDTPAMYYSPSHSHYVLEDKSFVRLQDVTLSYDLGKEILNKFGITGTQLYISGKNLYKWTNCSDWDPEQSSPVMRSIIAGVKMSF